MRWRMPSPTSACGSPHSTSRPPGSSIPHGSAPNAPTDRRRALGQAGEVGHQRFTLTQYPFLAIDDDTVVMIRHQWAMERLCGPTLYWLFSTNLGVGRPGDTPRALK